MSILGSDIAGDVGLRVLFSPIGSNIVVRTACCTVGTVLPVYTTFKAIESKDPNEQQKWLMYWAAYGSFSLVEMFTDKFIYWFPFYYHFKFAFLVWLQLPTAEGAKQLYKNHLCPFFLRYQDRFDQALGCVYHELVKLVSAHQGVVQVVKTLFVKVVALADQLFRGGAEPVRSRNRRAIEGQPRTDGTSDSDMDE